MPQYPPRQHPHDGWQQPYPHQPQRPPPLPRRKRAPLVLFLIVLLVAAAATTIVLASRDGPAARPTAVDEQPSQPREGGSQDGEPGIPTIPVDVPGWREGEPITEEALRAVPADNLFWIVYKRHSMTRVQELIQEPWVAPAGKPVGAEQLVTPQTRTIRVVFDYQSKEFAKASTGRVKGQLDSASICVDGKLYMKTATDLKEGSPYSLFPQDQNGARDCPQTLNADAYKQNGIIATRLNDAFMTGGLSSDQADKFIACLREQKLVSVTKVSTVPAAGKKYVAVEGEVNRIDDPDGSSKTKQGTNLLRQCFDDGTGLDHRHHPYPFIVGGVQGLKWTYYLDPNTLRPTFSKIQTTPVVGLDGSVSPDNAKYNESISWGQWNYPQAVPRFVLADGEQALRVAWPPDLPGK